MVNTFGLLKSSLIEGTALSVEPTVTETEQAHANCAPSFFSVEYVRNSLAKLQTAFILPAELDPYAPSTDDYDGAASILSIS